MRMTKRAAACFLILVMVLSLIPQAVFAKEVLVSPLHYEMSQRIHDDKMAATICLEFDKTNAVELEKVILPDGTEQINDLTIVNYDVFENGVYDFIVEYTLDSVKQEETIPVEVVELDKKTTINTAVKSSKEALDTTFQLKGATFFDGSPMWGTTQTLIDHKGVEVPYDGWQLMQLDIEIPYQEKLEVTSIQPAVESLYPEYSMIEKDDKNSKWTYSFFFKENGNYNFTINYSLDSANYSTDVSYNVEGLVSIKDIAMRRHLINTYGEFSGLSYQGGQYVTKDMLAKTLYDPWGNIVYDFGKDGDNGSTAQYTTSLDGLQYLTNIHGMYLYDCARLAKGETIEPITQGYYPNMKLFRLTNITDSSNNMPEGAYSPEQIAACIKNMPNLYELSISGTGFKDLPVIGELNGELGYLEADYNEIESIEGIEKHPEIYSISLGINKIKSLEPLRKANLSNVTFMDLGGNQIFDLSPMQNTLPKTIIAGQRFGARRQQIAYSQTVIASLKNDIYEIELPMPIDIDGTLTNTAKVTVIFEDGNSKEYSTTILGGKTYISIPKNDVDSNKENPFENAKFTFNFDNLNGSDSRTKGWFTGTVTFKVSPVAETYRVIYDFVSGTRGKGLPSEVTDLLPIDSAKYEEGSTITAIQPDATEVVVSDGVWTFKGYDADSKVANAANADKDRNVKFTGTWEFKKNEYRVIYDFVSGTRGKGLPSEVTDLLPIDSAKYEEGSTITAIQPDATEVVVSDGVWTFKGYDADSKVANAANADKDRNVKFVGTWEFKLNAGVINHIPTINASDKTITVGDEFNPLKDVTATDKEDGDIALTIENVIENGVDTSKVGVYEVIYKVTDSQGASSIKTIYVTVNPKMEVLNHIPTINANDKTLTVGDEFDPFQDVTAMDEEDGNLTSNIEILNNTVDTSKAGTYEVTYKVTDSKGASTIKTIKVNVIEEGIMVDPDQSDHNQTSDKDKTEEIHNIETGDNTNFILLGVLFIFSGIGIYVFVRKYFLSNLK